MPSNRIYCSICPVIESIVPHAQYNRIYCSIYQKLKSIVPYAQYNRIYCSICPVIESIVPYAQYNRIYCSICPVIEFIVPHVQYNRIYCSICPVIESIVPHVQYNRIYCSICPVIESIVPYAQYNRIYCSFLTKNVLRVNMYTAFKERAIISIVLSRFGSRLYCMQRTIELISQEILKSQIGTRFTMCTLTTQLTFENFSNMSSVVISCRKCSIELTFENFYPHKSRAGR